MNTYFRIFMLVVITGILGYWFHDAQNPDFSTGEHVGFALLEAFFVAVLWYAWRRDNRNKAEGL
jgi:hypothetical protein